MKLHTRMRNDVTTFLIVTGILVLLNLISTRTFFRLDMTKTQAYSLSKVSKQYMQELKDPITVKAFFTKRLPPPYNANARYLRDLLDDYRVYSNGRFNYQFVDPADDQMIAREARTQGVYEIQMTAVEKDKFEQKNGYMGLIMTYQDRKESIPLIQETSGLEYQLSSMIKKLTQKEMKVVAVTQGHGEPKISEQISNFNQLLSKNYEVVPVDLSKERIPERVDALIIAGPTEAFAEDQLYDIDHFLRSGKSMGMLVPTVKADARVSMQGRPVDTHLAKLLSAWGVNLQSNLVYDAQCQKITVAQRGPGFVMQNIVPYPPFPLVTEVDQEHLIVKNLQAFTLPFVSSLELNQGLITNHKLKVSVLAKSSKNAWAQMSFFMLSPQYIQPPQPNEFKQFDLMVTVMGAFPAAYNANNLPPVGQSGLPLPAYLPEAKPGRILVVGGADFITNDFIDPQRNDSLNQLVQNIVDWVAQDSALVDIRSKSAGPAALRQVPEFQRQVVKYFNLIGLPILVIVAGLIMWRRMENRRVMIANKFKA